MSRTQRRRYRIAWQGDMEDDFGGRMGGVRRLLGLRSAATVSRFTRTKEEKKKWKFKMTYFEIFTNYGVGDSAQWRNQWAEDVMQRMRA
jgi:hypothetical protein